MRRVLVTGATGTVGREVVRTLLARGIAVRAAGSPAAVRQLFGRAVEDATLDFKDPRTYRAAAAGCTELFLLRPPAISKTTRTLNPFIDAARVAGIQHVVFLSVAGAEHNRLVPHHAVEAHLAARGPNWTVLRPGFFAQNLETAYLRDIREDNRLYLPAGHARVAFVDVRDVAQVAATALIEPSAHASKGYTLTGPAAVSLQEVAEILSEFVGRSIRYVPCSVPNYVLHLLGRGLPVAQCFVQAVLHVGLRFGQAEGLDPTLATLLGRSPTSVREYIEQRQARWVV